jgi:hypothetical protein
MPIPQHSTTRLRPIRTLIAGPATRLATSDSPAKPLAITATVNGYWRELSTGQVMLSGRHCDGQLVVKLSAWAVLAATGTSARSECSLIVRMKLGEERVRLWRLGREDRASCIAREQAERWRCSNACAARRSGTHGRQVQ